MGLYKIRIWRGGVVQIFENNVLLWFIAVVVGTLISILIAPLRDFFDKILVDSFKWVWAS